MWQYRKSHEANRGFCTRMAELLWNCEHEEQHRRPERVAVQTHTDVYLEAVETATDAQTEASRSGFARMGRMQGSIQSKVILENGTHAVVTMGFK